MNSHAEDTDGCWCTFVLPNLITLHVEGSFEQGCELYAHVSLLPARFSTSLNQTVAQTVIYQQCTSYGRA